MVAVGMDSNPEILTSATDVKLNSNARTQHISRSDTLTLFLLQTFYSNSTFCFKIIYVVIAGAIGAVCSGSTLFASILNSSVMLGNCLQQTTSADDIFRCIFFSWRSKG